MPSVSTDVIFIPSSELSEPCKGASRGSGEGWGWELPGLAHGLGERFIEHVESAAAVAISSDDRDTLLDPTSSRVFVDGHPGTPSRQSCVWPLHIGGYSERQASGGRRLQREKVPSEIRSSVILGEHGLTKPQPLHRDYPRRPRHARDSRSER